MGCAAPVALAAWSQVLDRGDAAVAALDPDALGAAVDEADAQVPCLAGVAPRAEVARWFGLGGVRAFVAGEAPRATEAFAVARTLGGWAPPESLVGPIRQAFEAAATLPPAAERPLPPASGTWAVDGTFADAAPDGRPFLLQHVAPDGSVSTWRVGADDPLPEPPAVARPAPVPSPPVPPGPGAPVARPRAGAVALGVGGAVAAGLGVGLGAVAGGRRSAYYAQEPYPDRDAELHARRGVNAVGVPALGLMALGVGLGAGAVVVAF